MDKAKLISLWLVLVGMLVKLSQKQVKLCHSKFSSNVGSNLNKNSGGFTDLAQTVARIGGFGLSDCIAFLIKP